VTANWDTRMTGGRVRVVWRPDRICDVKAEEGYSGNGTVGSKARRTRDSAWARFLAAQQATGGDDDLLSLDWNILPALDKGDLHSVDSTERSIKTHHDSPPTTASPEYLQYTGRHRKKSRSTNFDPRFSKASNGNAIAHTDCPCKPLAP
jgi:hypothetical protein